jgi:hypothetical protein
MIRQNRAVRISQDETVQGKPDENEKEKKPAVASHCLLTRQGKKGR